MKLWEILYKARYGEKPTSDPSEMGLKDYRKGDVMIWMAWMLEHNLDDNDDDVIYEILKEEVR